MVTGDASATVTLAESTARFTLLGHLPGARNASRAVRDSGAAALSEHPTHYATRWPGSRARRWTPRVANALFITPV